MRVTILELPATYGAPARAIDGVDQAIAAGPATDLVLLPELALTGYVSPDGDFDVSRFAEGLDGPTAQRCQQIARERSVHLVAPLVLREGASLYNAMVCYAPSAPLFVYRKRRPWIPETWAAEGVEPMPVVEIAGTKVTIAICYDVHFVAADCPHELEQAGVLLFPSAWVEQPDNRAQHLIRIAKQFDIAIANANWGPGIVTVPGQGSSIVVGRDGRIVGTARNGRLDVEL